MTMRSRGQASFVRIPKFGARLYDKMMTGHSAEAHFADIARDVVDRGVGRRLLDVGTGPGRLLAEVRKLNPEVELHGLDISAAMVELAERNLRGDKVQLSLGSIRSTSYETGFFDTVICSGSFYLWDEPIACLGEIHRILAVGGRACLYESTRDFDPEAFRKALQHNLREEPLLRKCLAPHFLRRQLAMTYSTDEIRSIVAQTQFSAHTEVAPVTLGGLPVWLRVALTKE